jgi:hypothetical protein
MANIQVPTAAATMDDKWIKVDAGGPPPVPMLGQYENADADTRTLRMRYTIRVAAPKIFPYYGARCDILTTPPTVLRRVSHHHLSQRRRGNTGTPRQLGSRRLHSHV